MQYTKVKMVARARGFFPSPIRIWSPYVDYYVAPRCIPFLILARWTSFTPYPASQHLPKKASCEGTEVASTEPPHLFFPSFSLDRQALYRRYGRFFAEFLSEKSLVPLGLLALSTSVGLRYDASSLNLEVFLGRLFDYINEVKTSSYQYARSSPLKVDNRICQIAKALVLNAKPIRRIISFPPSLHRTRKGGPEY
jgi:hypothetical protein